MSDHLLVGDILNYLINGDTQEVLDQTTLLSKLQKDHLDIGAGIWDNIKSYTQYAKDKGAEWMAVVVEKIYNAFENIGQWLSGLNERYFVNVSMQFWKDLAGFAQSMVNAVAETISSLFEEFKTLFMHLFTKVLGLFTDATDAVKGWVPEISSILNVNATRAFAVLVEPFRLIGSLLSAYWIPSLISKMSVVVDTTCLAVSTAICVMVGESYNIDAYFDLASACELYGKSITLSRTLDIYDQEHLQTNNSHHVQFINSLFAIGKRISYSFPDTGRDVYISSALVLQLQDSWRARQGNNSLKIRTCHDMFSHGKRTLKGYLREDPSWWREIARSIFESKVLAERLKQIVGVLHTSYCPIDNENLPIDTLPLSEQAIIAEINQYNKRFNKNPKVVQKLKAWKVLFEAQNDIQRDLDNEDRAELLKQTLQITQTQHANLKALKVAQVARDRYISKLATDEEKIASIPLDSSEVVVSTLELINMQHTFVDYKFVSSQQDTKAIKALISSSSSAMIADRIPSSSSSSPQEMTKIMKDITHWIHNNNDKRFTKFNDYLIWAEGEIKLGRTVENFCAVPGNTLTPATVKRFNDPGKQTESQKRVHVTEYGVSNGGGYLFFLFYTKMYTAKYINNISEMGLQTLYDTLVRSLDRYDRIQQLLTLDAAGYYIGFGIGFLYLTTTFIVEATGLLKPVNPIVTQSSVRAVQPQMKEAVEAMTKIDAFMTGDLSNINPIEASLVEHLKNTKVVVDGREGGFTEFRGMLGLLSRFVANEKVQEPLDREQHAWGAQVAFAYLNKVMDTNTQDVSEVVKRVFKDTHLNAEVFAFKGTESDNLLTQMDTLSKFAYDVLAPIFPAISVLNAQQANAPLKGYADRFYDKILSTIREQVEKDNADINVATTSTSVSLSTTYLTPPAPSSSTPIDVTWKKPFPSFAQPQTARVMSETRNTTTPVYTFNLANTSSAETPSIHLDFHDTAIATQMSNDIHLFDEAVKMYGVRMDLQVAYAEYESLLALTDGIEASKDASMAEYLSKAQTSPSTVSAFQKAFEGYDLSLSPKDFVSANNVVLKDSKDATAYIMKQLEVIVHPSDDKQDVIRGRADDLVDSVFNFVRASMDENLYRKFQTTSNSMIPKNRKRYVAFSQARDRSSEVIKVLSKLARTSDARAFLFQQNMVMDNLATLTDPDSKQSTEYVELRRDIQPFLARMELARAEPKSPLLEHFKKVESVDAADRVKFVKETLKLMDDPAYHVVRTAFVQSLSDVLSPVPGLAVHEGSSVYANFLRDFFNRREDDDVFGNCFNKIPVHVLPDGKRVMDTQSPIAKAFFQSVDEVIDSYRKTHGATARTISGIDAAVARSREFKQMIDYTAKVITLRTNPYASQKDFDNSVSRLLKQIYVDDTHTVFRPDFSVSEFFENAIPTLKAPTAITTGSGYAVPYKDNKNYIKVLSPDSHVDADPLLAPIAGQMFATSETLRLFTENLRVLLEYSARESQLIQLRIWDDQLPTGDIIQMFHEQGYTGTYEEMREQFVHSSVKPGVTQAVNMLAHLRDEQSIFRAKAYKVYDALQATIPDEDPLKQTVKALANLSVVSHRNDVDKEFFSIVFTESLHSNFTQIMEGIAQNQADWTKNYDVRGLDLDFTNFFLFYMNQTLDYHKQVSKIPEGIKSTDFREVYTAFINDIFFQKLSLELDRVLSHRVVDYGLQSVSNLLVQLKETFHRMSIKAKYKYVGVLTEYGITDLDISYETQSFSGASKMSIALIQSQLPAIAKRLKDYSTASSAWNSLTSFFTKDNDVVIGMRRLGKASVSFVGTGFFLYSAVNSALSLASDITNLNTLIDYSNTAIPFISAGLNSTGLPALLGAKRKPDITYESAHNVFSEYAQTNNERRVLSNQQQVEFSKIRRFMQRMYSVVVDWSSIDGLVRAIWNICAGILSIDFTYRFIKQITQLLYHWYDDSISYTFDIGLPTSALTCAAIGGSLLLYLGDTLFSNGLKLWNMNRDDLFLSFPSLKEHGKGIAFFRSIASTWSFLKVLAGIYQGMPVNFKAPVINDPRGETLFLLNQMATNEGSLFTLRNAILGVGLVGNTLSAKSSAQTIYDFFKPEGYDLVDVVQLFRAVLVREFEAWADKTVQVSTVFKYIRSNDVNEILSADGILWMRSNIPFNRINVIEQYNRRSIPQLDRTSRPCFDFIIHSILLDEGLIVLKALNKTENPTQLAEFTQTFLTRTAIRLIIPLL